VTDRIRDLGAVWHQESKRWQVGEGLRSSVGSVDIGDPVVAPVCLYVTRVSSQPRF